MVPVLIPILCKNSKLQQLKMPMTHRLQHNDACDAALNAHLRCSAFLFPYSHRNVI